VREIAQRLILDLAVLAVAAPQQVGLVELVFVLARRGDDVGGSGACWHDANITPLSAMFNPFSDYKTNRSSPVNRTKT
jgi:hypothetical protein